MREEYSKKGNSFKYVANRILEIDGFGPTEEICLGEKAASFINVSDFNMKREQVILIDDSSCKNFDFAFEHLF